MKILCALLLAFAFPFYGKDPEIKTVTRLSDGSYLMHIDDLPYRAFSEKQMVEIIYTERVLAATRRELIECENKNKRTAE